MGVWRLFQHGRLVVPALLLPLLLGCSRSFHEFRTLSAESVTWDDDSSLQLHLDPSLVITPEGRNLRIVHQSPFKLRFQVSGLLGEATLVNLRVIYDGGEEVLLADELPLHHGTTMEGLFAALPEVELRFTSARIVGELRVSGFDQATAREFSVELLPQQREEKRFQVWERFSGV